MSVKKDASGRRYIQAEVEVPGTPEEVWAAIATGPGVSSWFVPTEKREDGAVVMHFGPGMDMVARQTAWEPPHRFAAEGEGFGPDAPPIATEWTVEARSGGTCIVRVVHSLFASTDDWDDQLESIESGWPSFFRILKLYLTHFRGQYGSTIQLVAIAAEPDSKVWDTLAGSLGFARATIGQQWNTPANVPRLAGLVEHTGEGKHPHQILLRLHEPTPGIAHLFAHAMGSQTMIEIRFYLYGNQATAAATRDEPLWHGWMNERFPPVSVPSNVG